VISGEIWYYADGTCAEIFYYLSKITSASSDDCDQFTTNISKFIFSTQGNHASMIDLTFWPLVKHIKIRCCCNILKHVILVDLPSGGDTNSARIAAAAKYMQMCDRMFIVADIA
jgi:hypothetical protein